MYNPRVRAEEYFVSYITKATADRRAGVVDRTLDGHCLRMNYDEVMKTETYPEMVTSNIGSVVLQMKNLGIDDVAHFDYMDPPGRLLA